MVKGSRGLTIRSTDMQYEFTAKSTGNLCKRYWDTSKNGWRTAKSRWKISPIKKGKKSERINCTYKRQVRLKKSATIKKKWHTAMIKCKKDNRIWPNPGSISNHWICEGQKGK